MTNSLGLDIKKTYGLIDRRNFVVKCYSTPHKWYKYIV